MLRPDHKPVRIQRKRTKGWRMPKGAIYVGRPGVYGNYFGGSDLGLELYRKKFECEDLSELRGRNLACWCALDQPCHADILLDLANR